MTLDQFLSLSREDLDHIGDITDTLRSLNDEVDRLEERGGRYKVSLNRIGEVTSLEIVPFIETAMDSLVTNNDLIFDGDELVAHALEGTEQLAAFVLEAMADDGLIDRVPVVANEFSQEAFNEALKNIQAVDNG